MDNDFRSRQEKSYILMRRIYDFSMSLLILGMAVVMFLGAKLGIVQLIDVDPLFRYLFGGICLLYGGFRLYRGIYPNY
jgi:uncharacterized membrane protein YfcA